MGSALRRGRGARAFPFLRCGCHAALPRVLLTPFLSEVPPCHRDRSCHATALHIANPCTQRRRSAAGTALCAPVVAARAIACLSQARSSSLASRLEPMMASSQLGADHFHGCTHGRAAPTYCGVNASGASSAALPPHLPTPAAIGPRYPIVAVVLCVRGSAVRISEVTSIINVSSLPGSRPHMTAPHIISTRVIPVAHRIHLIVGPRTVTRKAWTNLMHFVRSHMPHNLN